VGTQKLELGGPQLGWMRDSNELLGDIVAIQERLDTDGYLLLRQLIDPTKVETAAADITARLEQSGCVGPATDHRQRLLPPPPPPATAGPLPSPLLPRPPNMQGLLHSPNLLSVLEGDELHRFFSSLFGEAATTFDHKWFRCIGPGGFSGFHMDNVYMGRGSSRLHTVWVPWCEVTPLDGGLVVLEGSNSLPGFQRMRSTYGEHDVDRTAIRHSGHISHDSKELLRYHDGSRWVTADVYRPGDVVILAMKTLHGSIHNQTVRFHGLSSGLLYLTICACGM
jgi:hypothetical protein